MGKFVNSSGGKAMPLFLERYLKGNRLDHVVRNDFKLSKLAQFLIHTNLLVWLFTLELENSGEIPKKINKSTIAAS